MRVSTNSNSQESSPCSRSLSPRTSPPSTRRAWVINHQSLRKTSKSTTREKRSEVLTRSKTPTRIETPGTTRVTTIATDVVAEVATETTTKIVKTFKTMVATLTEVVSKTTRRKDHKLLLVMTTKREETIDLATTITTRTIRRVVTTLTEEAPTAAEVEPTLMVTDPEEATTRAITEVTTTDLVALEATGVAKTLESKMLTEIPKDVLLSRLTTC